ncbi:MAG TPA: hypothetical protein VIX90_17590 [Edaphobacter sp.]
MREAGLEVGLSHLVVGVWGVRCSGKPLAYLLIVGLAAAQVFLQNLTCGTEHEGRRRVADRLLVFCEWGIVCLVRWDNGHHFDRSAGETAERLVCKMLWIRGSSEVEKTDEPQLQTTISICSFDRIRVEERKQGLKRARFHS